MFIQYWVAKMYYISKYIVSLIWTTIKRWQHKKNCDIILAVYFAKSGAGLFCDRYGDVDPDKRNIKPEL